MTVNYLIDIIHKNDTTIHFHIKNKDQYLSFKQVFDLWKENINFINFYRNEIIKMGFQSFYWEHPALNKELLDKKYECAIYKSTKLNELPINEKAFKNFIHCDEDIVNMMNLGKNARLIIPTKKSSQEIYNHFGKFLRYANTDQLIKLFNNIGNIIYQEIDSQKVVWLSTSGLGVIWLHIRMDTKPKYYKTIPYKNPAYLQDS